MCVTEGDNGNGEGTIRVSGEFDREIESLISLPIYMCDSGVPVKCGTRYMEVKVTDEDDVIHSEGNQVITVYNYKGNPSPFMYQGSHKLWKSWKTWKITKKSWNLKKPQ